MLMLITVLNTFFALAFAGGERATSPVQFVAGQEVCWRQAESGKHTSELGGNRQRKWTRRDEIGWVFKVLDAGPGGATIEARIVYVRFRFESDVTAFDRDTRRPESFVAGENGPEPEFLRLVDRPFTITLDNEGRVRDVAGADELLAELGESVQMRVNHLMSPEAIRHWPLFAAAGAPAGASAGATWSDRFATGVDFVWVPPSDVQASYRLESADDKRTEVEVAYNVTPKPPPPTTRPSIAEPPKFESDWKGTLTFDRGTGLLIKAVSNLEATTRQTVFGNINTTQESDVTFTFEQVDRSAFQWSAPGPTTLPGGPATAASAPADADGIDLGARFQPGQRLEYKILEAVHAHRFTANAAGRRQRGRARMDNRAIRARTAPHGGVDAEAVATVFRGDRAQADRGRGQVGRCGRDRRAGDRQGGDRYAV